MSFAREGLPFIIGSAIIAALAFVVAVVMRSWPLWLLAFVLALVTLGVAYRFRDPERRGERGERPLVAPVSGVVRFRHYNPGKFLNAAGEKTSRENAQASVAIGTMTAGVTTLGELP